jgi:hypothetical protein
MQNGSLDDKRALWDQIVAAFSSSDVSDGWVRVRCPMCEEALMKKDTKASLGLNPTTGGFNCFKCGTKGRLPKTHREQLALAVEDYEGKPQPEKRTLELADGYTDIFSEPAYSSESFRFAIDYLLQPRTAKNRGGRACRGLPETTCREMQIGAAISGRLSGRVIIPIPDYTNPSRPWRGWISRDATGTSTLPYRYPLGMNRGDLLFNEPALYVATDTPVYICEGAFDAAPLWPDAVACLGKPLPSHLELFLKARRPVVVTLDGDAWEESWVLCQRLRFYGKRAGFIKFPPKIDPNEISPGWTRAQGIQSLST